jgi:hypothetical protein
MAKKSGKSSRAKAQKRTPNKRGNAGAAKGRAAGGRRKTAGAKTPKGKAARKSARHPPRPGKRGSAAKSQRPKAKGQEKSQGPKAKGQGRRGGTGREETLAQTPETGRSRRGPTNPMATRRSTGTASGAGDTRRAPGLERERKRLRELEETIQGPPSSLNMDRSASSARTGRQRLHDAMDEHSETGPVMTGGDVDADWEDAYSVGDEAPGGDNPTPDQDVVDEIGKAIGIEYQDNEELKGADKVAERDRHRWELDPASSDDYKDRD